MPATKSIGPGWKLSASHLKTSPIEYVHYIIHRQKCSVVKDYLRKSLHAFHVLFSKDLHVTSKHTFAVWTKSLGEVGKNWVKSPPSKKNNFSSMLLEINNSHTYDRPFLSKLVPIFWTHQNRHHGTLEQENIKCLISSTYYDTDRINKKFYYYAKRQLYHWGAVYLILPWTSSWHHKNLIYQGDNSLGGAYLKTYVIIQQGFIAGCIIPTSIVMILICILKRSNPGWVIWRLYTDQNIWPKSLSFRVSLQCNQSNSISSVC